ncbi:unnamed protein product, partial [Rotaria sp. Silwood1]
MGNLSIPFDRARRIVLKTGSWTNMENSYSNMTPASL